MAKPYNIVTSATGPPNAGDRLAESLPLRPVRQSGIVQQRGGRAVQVIAATGQTIGGVAPVGGGGGGTASSISVGLSAPATFTVTGSPVTTSGTIVVAWQTVPQNFVLVGPVSGAGVPTFRALTVADVPAGASGAKATTAVFGTVETDITEAGGSVVYTRTTADAKYLLAAQKSANLADLASASTARTNLGLGTAAVVNVPASGNASSVQAVLGNDTRLTASVQKRRVMLGPFSPASPTAADAAPNTAQMLRLPLGAGGASSQWKLMSATLRVEVPNAAATTVQVYYVANPGNAAFGSGTAALSAALSASGTTTYEISTTAFSGTLASAGLPSGSVVAPQFTAVGGTVASLEIEFEEV